MITVALSLLLICCINVGCALHGNRYRSAISPSTSIGSKTLLSAKRRIKASVTVKRSEDLTVSESSEKSNMIADELQSWTPVENKISNTIPNKVNQDITTENSFKELLQNNLDEFTPSSQPQEKNAIVSTLKDAVGVILIADFFVVIGFLVWFLAAAALQSTNPFLLEKFQDVFQPVVVPCLTVLMVGSFLSGVAPGQKKVE